VNNLTSTKLIEWKESGEYFLFQSHKIFYKVIGNGKPLLIIHGYPYNSFDFEKIIPTISANRMIILLDLLGLGFSDKPKDHKYSFEEYSEMISALLNKLKISSVDILAYDLGVSVAQEILAKYEEGKNSFQVGKILFLNGGLFSDVYKPRLIQRILSQSPNFIGKFISKKLTRKKIESSVLNLFGKNTKPSEELLDQFWEILNYNEGKSISYLIGRLVFEKIKFQTRWITSMQKTKIPLCYICGPFDPNSGMHMAKRFSELLPGSKVYLLSEEIGHWPQIECAKEVSEIINRVLSES
jgi:pimeloyl-ACP methyl ester carboxylesterase